MLSEWWSQKIHSLESSVFARPSVALVVELLSSDRGAQCLENGRHWRAGQLGELLNGNRMRIGAEDCVDEDNCVWAPDCLE